MNNDDNEVTRLLKMLGSGDQSAAGRLYELIYPHLQRLAQARRNAWSGDFTMTSSALISEAYLKLTGSGNQDWQNRVHFFRVASRAMHQILLNYRDGKKTEKRGGGIAPVEYRDDYAAIVESAEVIAALEEALQALDELDDRLVRVFECRRLGGLSIAETASQLGLSVSTVKRDSKFVESWLKNRMAEA